MHLLCYNIVITLLCTYFSQSHKWKQPLCKNSKASMTHLPILALLVTSLYVAHLLNDSKKVKCTMVQCCRNYTMDSQFQIRMVCISDTHSAVENLEIPFKIPDGDILIHAGDFTNYGEVDKVKEFNTWLGTLPHTHKIVVAGNRDISFDPSVVGPNNIYWDRLKHPELSKVGN